MNYTYCYYIDDDSRFAELVVSLTSLMETKPKYPIACMVGKYVKKETRDFLTDIFNVNVIDVSDVDLSEKIYDTNGVLVSDCNCSGKMALYRLNQYDKIVYLDTDTLIVKNIDELFQEPDGSMARYCWDEKQRLNGGILVCVPNDDTNNAFKKYIADSVNIGRFIIPDDQEWLMHYYNSPKLNYCYNTVVSDLNRYKDSVLFDIGSVKVFHFVGTCFNKKLWDLKETYLYNVKAQSVIKMYLDRFNSIIHMYKTLFPNLAELLRY